MDRKELRSQNLNLLRRILLEKRLATKPELADASGLSVVTVNNLLKELLQANEVQAEKLAESTGGRPAMQYRYCAERKLVLVGYMYEDHGRDTLHVMLVNLLGEPLPDSDQLVMPERVDFAFFTQTFQEYVQKYPEIMAVLVGLPGVELNGRLQIIDYSALKEAAFSAKLAAWLDRPVEVVNDINATIAGYGASQGTRTLKEIIIGVYWPKNYPPGAGILLHGELYTGRDGMAGEIGGRFADAQIDQSRTMHEEAVAAAIILLTQTWNPHELFFYDEQLSETQLAHIQKRAVRESSGRFLPAVRLRRELHQDYRRGMCMLAGDFLQKAEIGTADQFD